MVLCRGRVQSKAPCSCKQACSQLSWSSGAWHGHHSAPGSAFEGPGSWADGAAAPSGLLQGTKKPLFSWVPAK